MNDRMTAPDYSLTEAVGETAEAEKTGYWPERANSALSRGDFSQVLELCGEKLTGARTDPVSGYLLKGKALLALGKLEEAAEEFHLALRRDPANPVALKFLGDIRFSYGAEAVAFSYYERARKSQASTAGLCSVIGGAIERALRGRISGQDAEPVTIAPEPESSRPPEQDVEEAGLTYSSASAQTSSDTESSETATAEVKVIELPQIEVEDESPSSDAHPGSSVSDENVGNPNRDSSPVSAEGKGTTKLVFQRAAQAEAGTLKDARKREDLRVTADIQRFDRLYLAPEFRTETTADLLMRQGHIRAARDILSALVRHSPTPELVEKLNQAEAADRKKGQ